MSDTPATFKDSFVDWVDWDYAEYLLGHFLGIFPSDSFFKVKGVLWSDNSTSNYLYNLLEALVLKEILLKKEEPDLKYRWNKSCD